MRAQAMIHLGNVIHLLQDGVSPSHELFQQWFGPGSGEGTRTGRVLRGITHAMSESEYPQDDATRGRLEGATRWVFDLFKRLRHGAGLTGSEIFFDANGELNLPDQYSAPVAPSAPATPMSRLQDKASDRVLDWLDRHDVDLGR